MKVIIIDDELNGREILSTLISKFIPEVQHVHLAKSAAEGIQLIVEHNPDIVFLDVEMPNINGFDMLESKEIANSKFNLIFVTAFENYALRAFDFKAVDYLLKPIELDHLKRAVSRCIDRTEELLDASSIIQRIKKSFAEVSKIRLATREGYEFVPLTNIICCKSEGNYTRLYLQNEENRLMSKTLKTFESDLIQNGFARIHKSHIINLNYVTNYLHGKSGWVRMTNGLELEVSKDKKETLLKLLSL